MFAVTSIYEALPVSLQELAVSGVGLRTEHQRYGKLFARLLSEYEQRARWSRDRLIEFRNQRLADALRRASHAPFFRDLMRDTVLGGRGLSDPANLALLPVLTKAELQSRRNDFLVRSHQPGDVSITTSGTTGKSLELTMSRNVDSEQWAVWWRYRRSHGIDRETPMSLFASNPIVPSKETSRFWRRNFAQRETRYSVYHISAENASAYVAQLNKERKPWIHGNPSAIALLAHFMNTSGLRLDFQPRWITVGSENLTPNYRSSIERAFGVRPIQHYGLAEANANFSECVRGALHVDEDFAFVEFIPLEDKAYDSVYRVVGTSFANEATAVVRYDTGDLVRLSDEDCDCGLLGRVVESIDGRQGDYIVLPNGAHVASLASPFHATTWLSEGQILQRLDGVLEVRYVPVHGPTRRDLFEFEERLRARVGYDIAVEFREFTRIPRTGRGKIRLVERETSA